MKSHTGSPDRYCNLIRDSRLTIYDPIEPDHPRLRIPTADLERLLKTSLMGISLAGLPPRTRSKYVKEHVCRALGYPIPSSFRRTQPRFPGQNFDVYVQKSNNLQIWNEELTPTRRYVIILVDPDSVIMNVRVVTGAALAALDTTGTVTQKYQARLTIGADSAELVSGNDTAGLQRLVAPRAYVPSDADPLDDPKVGQLRTIHDIFDRLRSIIGTQFSYLGSDQERNRGGALHALVCHRLGYGNFRDDGQFPDIRHQLIELKLQISRTIDLGLTLPNSMDPIPNMPFMDGFEIRVCDVRYVLFCAAKEADNVTLTHLFVTTGEDFLDRFQLSRGNVLNKKIQISLPPSFFD